MVQNTTVAGAARRLPANSIAFEIMTTLRVEVEMLKDSPAAELSPERIAGIEHHLQLIEDALHKGNSIVVEDYEVHPNGMIHECGGDTATITDVTHAILHMNDCYDWLVETTTDYRMDEAVGELKHAHVYVDPDELPF